MAFTHNIDSVILEVAGFPLRWYGLIFALGFAICFIVFKYLARKEKLPLSEDDFNDYFLYGIVGTLVGARLGSVISNISFYFENPSQILAFWEWGDGIPRRTGRFDNLPA